MWILGIETSGKTGEIALQSDETLVESRPLSTAGGRHAQTLVAEIDALLDRHRLNATDVGLVAVSIGPGSFTGLRVGVVFAKTFCYVTKTDLVAVDTLRAVAENCPPDVERVHVLADAQRGDVYVGIYRRNDAGWLRREGEVVVWKLEDFARDCRSAECISGPVLERYAGHFDGRCRVLPRDFWNPRAETVAQIGFDLAGNGELADLWALEPFYIRKSAAEEKRDLRSAEHPGDP